MSWPYVLMNMPSKLKKKLSQKCQISSDRILDENSIDYKHAMEQMVMRANMYRPSYYRA